MSASADHNYNELITGIISTDIEHWEYQISKAEKDRLHDITVMDIIGAVRPADECMAESGGQNGPAGVISQWIQLAVMIEEKQYV